MREIMLIDDDEDYIRLMVTVLRDMQLEPICIQTEAAALNLCFGQNDHQINLVISDIQMPWFESEKIAKVLSDSGKLVGVPVVLCSGVFSDAKHFDVEQVIKGYEQSLHIQFMPKGNISLLRFQIREALKLRDSLVK